MKLSQFDIASSSRESLFVNINKSKICCKYFCIFVQHWSDFIVIDFKILNILLWFYLIACDGLIDPVRRS